MSTVAERLVQDPLDRFRGGEHAPRWALDILRYLPVKSHFLLTGNVRDCYPFPGPAGVEPLSLVQYLSAMLRLSGYEHVLGFDIVDGFYALGSSEAEREATREYGRTGFNVRFLSDEREPMSRDGATKVIEQLIAPRDGLGATPPVAVIIDYASRLVAAADHLSQQDHEFFTRMLKLSHRARTRPISPLGRAHHPVVWIADRETDLPSWAFGENEQARIVPLPLPDARLRRVLIEAVAPSFSDASRLAEDDREEHLETFVQRTEALALQEVLDVVQLARQETLGLRDIGEAVRRYKVGVPEDRWARIPPELIADGEGRIGERVKGQRPAIVQALDIVKRAMTGLAGAQASSSGSRPKGVLFLAGPTGVGKTELAKALTALLFGDEEHYIRFDMSEFSAEHSAARLLGAPPGYIGHDAGGELINAVREKPVSLILFDEIEKAHERILDKFLQLLDDGVMTSGRGEKVYFSDCIIVFTSNLGILRKDATGEWVPTVTADDPDRKEKIVQSIKHYFTYELGRPEILNRIGENIVVFDFIQPDVAVEIFDKMFAGVVDRLKRKGIDLELSDDARQALLAHCTDDPEHGGRGIGNQLEKWLINPLARALFDQEVGSGSRVQVAAVGEQNGAPTVMLRRVGES